MAKDVIKVDGEDKVVREDVAKSYRGVIWALLSVGAFVIVALILLLGGFLSTVVDDSTTKTPAQIEQQGK